MREGVLVLNFGEPEEPRPEAVVPYLERIFAANADLEGTDDPADRARRSRELAERRAPGLLEEYREIGGSPLNRQARSQARALEEELRDRGREVGCWVGMQFTEPTVAQAAEQARRAGVSRLVGVPVYPLCGRSTTVAALRDLDRAVEEMDWEVERADLTGWHRHPDYLELRARNLRSFCRERGIDLSDPETLLVFSAHGTPRKYLEEGSRYETYVEEFRRELSRRLGGVENVLGYQNHGNRGVPWTEPEVEDVVADVSAGRIVVEPVSFMHEQSETLVELDEDLREAAEQAGLEFHRVPVPWDDPAFPRLLADLVSPLLEGDGARESSPLASCQCKADGTAWCHPG